MVTITESSIRQTVFQEIYNLINANKPSGWTILSAFPEVNPTFPCIVINPASITLEPLALNISGREYRGNIIIDFYNWTSNGKQSMDSAKDTISEVFIDNDTNLLIDGFIFMGITNDDSDKIIIGGENVNSGTFTVDFLKK